MLTVACVIGGLCLIGCGFGLSRLRPPNWEIDGELAEVHHKAITRWSSFQRIVRLLNNSLIMIIGALMIASTLVPRGREWMLIWFAILVLLLICILFAMIDAFSSLAGYRRALPEAARRSFSGSNKVPPLEN